MPHEQLFQHLVQKQQVYVIANVVERLSQEKKGLRNLQLKPQCYLNQYDQLFRLISIWLLIYGFDLSAHQPHQTLKAICLEHMPHIDVNKVIRERHALKKGQKSSVSDSAQHGLDQLSYHFKLILQAYIKPNNSNYFA